MNDTHYETLLNIDKSASKNIFKAWDCALSALGWGMVGVVLGIINSLSILYILLLIFTGK